MLSDSIDGVGIDLLGFAGERRFATILADPPWQFTNKTGKIAPEHKRLARYRTLTLDEIKTLPVPLVAAQRAHLYLWCQCVALERLGSDEGVGLHLHLTTSSGTRCYKHVRRMGEASVIRKVTELIVRRSREERAHRSRPDGGRLISWHAEAGHVQSRYMSNTKSSIVFSLRFRSSSIARGTRENWAMWGNQADDYSRQTEPVTIIRTPFARDCRSADSSFVVILVVLEHCVAHHFES